MKKICCIILALMLMMQTLQLVSAAESPMLSLTEVLGIMPENRDDEFVSRGEFLSRVLQTLKMDYEGYSDEPVFTDLTVSHAYYGAIMFAVKAKIVSGNGSGRFYPDDYITGEQAAIMILNACGYRNAAVQQGYFPFALQFGLMKNTSVSADAPVTGADARIMLLNLLNAPYPETSYVLGETMVKEGDDTFLNRVWGMYSETGVVESTELRSMSLSSEKTGYVSIGGVRYNCARMDMDPFFGMQVRVFYSENEYERELVYAYPTGKNNTEQFSGKNFVSFDGTELIFHTGGRSSQSYQTGSRTALLWNNRTVSSDLFITKSLDNPERFELIDNDGDGIFDAVCMYTPKIYYGGFVDTAVCTITDKDYPDLKLDDYRNYLICDADGKKLEIEQLKDSWHYIVYDPEDKNFCIKVVASDVYMEDEVAEVDFEGKTVLLKAGGLCEILPHAKISASDFTVGSKYNLYFDAKGRIIDADETAKKSITAVYLMAAKLGDLDDLHIKMLTEKNEISVVTISSDITFRGFGGTTEKLSTDEIFDRLKKDGVFLPQLVFIRQNNEGEIISMIQVCDDNEKPYHVQEYTKHTDSEISARRWLSGQQSFSNEIQLKSSTKVFVVPDHTLTGQDDTYYSVTTTSIFNNDANYVLNEYPGPLNDRYTSTPVVVSEGGYAADYFVLECPAETEFSSNSMVYGIITDITDSYDVESGERLKMITMLNTSNREEKYNVKLNGGELTDRDGYLLERGDLVQIKAGGSILKSRNVLLYYDRSEDKYHYITSFDKGTEASNEIGYRFYAGFRVTSGEVLDIEDGVAVCSTIAADPESTHIEYIKYTSGKIVDFRTGKRKYELLDGKYLKKGDRYVACMSGGQFKQIIFYE